MKQHLEVEKMPEIKKKTILEHLHQLLIQKQTYHIASIDDLNTAIANETKSSAGDKYETSRAMAQQEIDQLSTQLEETNRQIALLSGLTIGTGESIQMGSLVRTSLGWFFIGIPVGKIAVKNSENEVLTVQCISSIAPLSQQLMRKESGESVVINGIIHEIQLVLNV